MVFTLGVSKNLALGGGIIFLVANTFLKQINVLCCYVYILIIGCCFVHCT